MSWTTQFPAGTKPTMDDVGRYVQNPLWEELMAFFAQAYPKSSPAIEYSRCGGAPGWNVKFKKSSRALCTLYPEFPEAGVFTCLICIGSKAEAAAEIALASCTPQVQQLYASVAPFNGSRWLMIAVTSGEVLDDVKRLLNVRAQVK